MLTKTLFVKGITCPKELWMTLHMPEEKAKTSVAGKHRMEIGQAVGLRAHGLFPNGVLAAARGISAEEAHERTLALIEEGVEAIFEATFIHEDLHVRVDILAKDGDGWRVVEVKASGSHKPKYTHDVAFQVHVLRSCGIKVTGASLAHLNKKYVWPGGDLDPNGLLEVVDITEEVEKRLEKIPEESNAFLKLWDARDYPKETGVAPHHDPGLRPACRGCDFEAPCRENASKDHVFYISLNHSRIKKLRELGVTTIGRIPDDFLTDRKELMRLHAFRTGTPQIDLNLRERLDEIQFPAHFIDFETVRPDLPILPSTRPYEQFAFQWSNHTLPDLDATDITKGHTEFLHQELTDPRAAFAKSLYEAIKGGGSVLHYHQHEKLVIKELAELSIPYAGELMKIVESRFIDLQHILAECYIDHRFNGLTSIKSVLPVVAPELRYEDLEIKDGDQAQIEYVKTFSCSEDERQRTYQSLKQYCRLDTWAMVMVLKALRAAV